jgi:hypothetical protein
LPTDVGAQIEVVERVAVEGGIADGLRATYRDPGATPLEHDVPYPSAHLLVIALLRREIGHGRRPGRHVDARDHTRVLLDRDADPGRAVVTHAGASSSLTL